MTPAQYALREQLPQSDLYQTPTRFGFASSANNTAQPTGFASNQGPNGTLASQFPSTNLSTLNPAQQQNAMQRNNTRIATPDRFGGTQWEQGQPQGTQSPQMSSPTIQGFLPTTLGDNSLLEYERDIQRQNAEINQIRQEIDAQRQLPGSENYSTYGRK